MIRGFVTALAVCLSAATILHAKDPAFAPKGQGILNLVAVTDADTIGAIDEVFAFYAFGPDPRTGSVHFELEFENTAFGKTAMSPSVAIVRDGVVIATFRPDIHFSDSGAFREEPHNSIEFFVSPDYVRESRIRLQFYPNTEKLITYDIHLLSAIAFQLDGDRVSDAKLPMEDFLNRLEQSTEVQADEPE